MVGCALSLAAERPSTYIAGGGACLGLKHTKLPLIKPALALLPLLSSQYSPFQICRGASTSLKNTYCHLKSFQTTVPLSFWGTTARRFQFESHEVYLEQAIEALLLLFTVARIAPCYKTQPHGAQSNCLKISNKGSGEGSSKAMNSKRGCFVLVLRREWGQHSELN